MNFDQIALATDMSRVQAGGKSIFEKVADATTYGIGAAVVSGLGSLYNTAVWASNNVFGTNAEELDTKKVLTDLDENWGKYYEANKDVVDTVGFLGGSFIPGGIAVKGLNLARKGESLGAFRSALGYSVRRQNEYLEAGLKDIAAGGGDVFATINRNKLLSMGWGTVDNVLQTAVFETAAAVAMQRSSTLAGESWTDISWDIAKTSLVGGVLGGGIEALWTNKIFRNAGQLVDKKSRAYDTVVALDKIGLGLGDRAFSVVDDLLKLPKEVFEADKNLAFSYRLNGADHPIQLETGALFEKQLKASTEKAYLVFQKNLTEAITTDTSVGAPLAKALKDVVHDGVSAGKTPEEIRSQLLSYLGNLESVHSLGGTKVDFTKDVFYLQPGATLVGAKLPDAQELFSVVRGSNSDKGYRIVGDVAAAKTGIVGVPGVGDSVQKAFESGMDIVYAGEKGKVHINPKSKIFKPVQDNDDGFLRTTFNTRTKETTDMPVPTIADMADKGVPIVNKMGVSGGKYTYQFDTGNFQPTLSSIKNTARHLWAAEIKDLRGATIDARDFSLLDRILADPDLIDKSTKIKFADGSIDNIPTNFRSWLAEQKVAAAQDLFNAGGKELDHRLVSYALNTEQGWVQDVIAHEFNVGKVQTPDMFRDLKSYAARDNVVMVYRKPPIADPNNPEFATGMIGYQHRKKMAQDRADTAAATVLRKAFERFIDLTPEQLRGKFVATGAGPTGFGSSNANYDDIAALWAQDVGKAVDLTQKERRNAVLEKMQPLMAQIISTGNVELGAVLQRLRFSEDRMALLDGKLVTLADYKNYTKLREKVLTGEARPDALEKYGFKYAPIPLKEDTRKFLEAYHETHKAWLNDHNQLSTAMGKTNDWDADALYLPPLNTRAVPYFAFVRAAEGRVFASTETAMITAKSADELKALAAKIEADHPDLQVIYKADNELYHRALGDYEFSKSLNQPTLDPLLRKQGKLGNYIPTLEPKAVVEDFVSYIGRREDELVRSAVQVKYGQTFSELDWLSQQYTKAETSKIGYLGKMELKKVADPFGDYKRLALNISKKAEYTLWNNMNEFVDALGTKGYAIVEENFRRAKAGETTWEEANASLERVGLNGVFNSQADYLKAQTGADRSIIKLAVAKANTLLATITLRLDTANALVNTISTPILLGTEVQSIRNSIKNMPELAAKFDANFYEAIPGQTVRLPSTTRLLYEAVKNYFSKDKDALIDRYQNVVGSIRNDASLFHEMLQDMSLTPNIAPKAWSEKVDKWVEKGASLTGNNSAEQFTRFVSSDVMRQITQPVVDAGKMSIKEQNAFISIFVNRVQGNYISSQRPIAFQGVIGAAIGLFQTYQFNMFQQLFRHIENRDAKTLAVAAGMQSSIFGIQGLPLFEAINTHIIGNANINEQHKDVYSTVAAADKEWGDFAMYGLSAMPLFGDKAPALYTRGDLNPRHITIIPTSFSQIPAVEGMSRVFKAVWDIGNQAANGGNFGDALLHGLEHNGISRPLAGLAQVVKGDATTNQGSLISANIDLLSITTAARLLGAKPIDESIALNEKFRQVAYKAADKERIENLGRPIKEKIRAGNLTEEDVTEFAARYAAAGGRMESYGAAMQRWMKDANQSILNTAMNAHRSPYGQRMFEIMGGDPINDYLNQPGASQ